VRQVRDLGVPIVQIDLRGRHRLTFSPNIGDFALWSTTVARSSNARRSTWGIFRFRIRCGSPVGESEGSSELTETATLLAEPSRQQNRASEVI
jgi:hypothetical protein